MMYCHRALEACFNRYLSLFPAVAVTGPRQSGKSTLVKAALPRYPYVSFDDPEELRAAEHDPRGFLARFPERVIIDEAQKAGELFSYIKMSIDAKRGSSGRFVLTGSNQFALSKNLSESLAGRVGLLSLLPFERSEMPASARKGQILLGSYPELAVRSHEGAREWYSSYLGTYLERDVRSVYGIGKLSDFQGLLQLLAARCSQEYNASALARDIGVDSKTVEAWVSILEASYILFRLRPWQANIGKRLVKRPKIYFWDTGLVCHLTGIRSQEALSGGPLAGPVFENSVIAELLKGAIHRGKDIEAFYFRESNGLEADFIIHGRDEGQWEVFEIKAGQTAKSAWAEGVSRVGALLSASLHPKTTAPRCAIIYQGESLPSWPTPATEFLNFEEALSEWQTARV